MGEDGGLALRTARWILVAYLWLHMPSKVADAFYYSNTTGVIAAVALYAIPMLYALPLTRPFWTRHRWCLLGAQAILTYLPFALLGQQWVPGMSGLLCGLLLLTLTGPLSWTAFSIVILIEGLLWTWILGVPNTPGASTVTWVITAPVNSGLALFGLGRLADLVAGLVEARAGVATLATAQERLRAARELRTAVGDRLVAAFRQVDRVWEMLGEGTEQARSQIGETARIAREALADIRTVIGHPPRRVPVSEPIVAPKIAWLVLAYILCAFAAQNLMNVLVAGPGPQGMAFTAATIAVISALQVYHSSPRRRGIRPRMWVWSIGAQGLLSFALYPAFGEWGLGMQAFLIGSLLLLMPRPWGLVSSCAVVTGVAMLVALSPDTDPTLTVYVVFSISSSGLVVYGLSRLATLAVEWNDAHRQLARMAVVNERLRMARDVHDLLGLGLSAIALKSDLVVALLDRDEAKARHEIEELALLCARSQAELQAVTDEFPQLSLRSEIDSTRQVLTSAGIEVHTSLTSAPIAPGAESVLVAVFREAVTNALRHASPRRINIGLVCDEHGVMLQVVNDGASSQPGNAVTGHGLANIRARAEHLGGQVTSGGDADEFEIVVRVPVATLEPTSIARDTDGVDAVART